MFPEASRQADFVLGPVNGQVSALAVTTTSASQDLQACGNQTQNAANKNQVGVGLVGLYVTFTADGGDVYYNFSATAGTVDQTQRGANATNGAMKIPANTSIDIKITTATRFINYQTASGTAVLRFAPTSPTP